MSTIRRTPAASGNPSGSPPRTDRRTRGRAEELVRSVNFVVLSTARTDRYGRYLADVFGIGMTGAAAVAAEEIYLNRKLLEEGSAGPYV